MVPDKTCTVTSPSPAGVTVKVWPVKEDAVPDGDRFEAAPPVTLMSEIPLSNATGSLKVAVNVAP